MAAPAQVAAVHAGKFHLDVTAVYGSAIRGYAATSGTQDAAHTIAAPGACINSTWKGGVYRRLSGTSMATPHVTGAVGLCIATARCAGLTPAQIVEKVRADAAARPLSCGFVGDPSRPIVDPGGTTRSYGHLRPGY